MCRIYGVACLLVLVPLFACHSAEAGTKARKPNIIVIVGDDMGYADIGVHGCTDIPTPHIDSIARNGVRCTSGYVSGPYCSPTRAGLLTGRYQTRFGHEFNPGPKEEKGVGLPLSQMTLADRLRALGYITGLVGKWHLGYSDEFHPQSRFQEFFGFLGGAHSYVNLKKGIMRGKQEVDEKEYLTDAFRREAVDFVKRHQKEPFFLYLCFNAVHGPMEAADKYLQRFPKLPEGKRKTYAAMMVAMDDAIGALLAQLRESGLEEDTLIFFISDNGGPTAVNASSNAPLNGVKATTWEGGIRVPWLVQWKGHLPAGKTYDQPVIQLDIVPTALAAAGNTPREQIDGVNLFPYLKGEITGAPHAALYWRFGPQMAIRKGDWVLVETKDSNGKKLFNLRDDIGQKNDLSTAEPQRVRELQAAWDAWNKENIDPLWRVGKAKNKNK